MRWRIICGFLLLGMGALGLALVGLVLHSGWLHTELWILAPFVLMAAMSAFVVLTAPAVAFVAVRGRSGVISATCLLLVAGVVTPAVLTVSPDLRARARFYLERPAFGRVVELARAGRLASGSYHGARLPGELCFVSATCGVVTWRAEDGGRVLFVPDRVGIPDDAVGYAHFTGAPRGAYDGFGMRICPSFELADGWWWLDACGG
ncbi:hypothetical protein [Nonomuraea sp. NPDC049709]|uniref:hypothetical protein n=1 Tax=Nonomuraea sp. NPDC049709 TaxID=3154736 RepID=UPI0034178A0D